MGVIEICDMCHSKRPDRRFKVKMSKWNRMWQFYERIDICEDCAEKLFGIKSKSTVMDEIRKNIEEQKEKNKKGE